MRLVCRPKGSEADGCRSSTGEALRFRPVARTRRAGRLHHTFARELETGSLECDLVLLRPVQVAAGLLDFVRGDRSGEQIASLQAMVTRQGQRVYALPGSSLKGAIRSLAEAVSYSCLSIAGGTVRQQVPTQLRRCTRLDELCPACRLFGMTGVRHQNYMGCVHVADVLLPPGGRVVITRTPLLWAPARSRRGLPGRYLKGRYVRGRKFYFHGRAAAGPDARVALDAGQTLRALIHFDNLSPALLGVLLTALGLNPEHPFPIKVGAGLARRDGQCGGPAGGSSFAWRRGPDWAFGGWGAPSCRRRTAAVGG